MAKKKPVRRKAREKLQPRITVPAATNNSKNIINISNDDPTMCFSILDDNGVPSGEIEDTTSALHRLCLIAQRDAFDNDTDDYQEAYANALSKKYDVRVSSVAAYRIANYVFASFGAEKKNTDG